MKIIVCLDDDNGMLFLGKRQSKDSVLRQRVLQLTEHGKLWMNGYSARQFEETAAQVCLDEAFLEKAETGDWCFVENTDITPFLHRMDQLILYHWNRRYPSSVKFPMERVKAGLSLHSSFEFAGSSHERITEEVYFYEDQTKQ